MTTLREHIYGLCVTYNYSTLITFFMVTGSTDLITCLDCSQMTTLRSCYEPRRAVVGEKSGVRFSYRSNLRGS